MANKSQKLTDELKLQMRKEFIEGVEKDGKRHYPSIDELVNTYNVSRATAYRRAKDEDWQRAKNQFHTKLQQEQEEMRISSLVAESKRLDSNSLQIAQAMLGRVGRALQRAAEREQQTGENAMTPQELRELSHVTANAQKIGKLALGEAQEISKVSADVSAPESFREIIEQLDELAAARSEGSNHTIQ
jgi:vacuolar-type H+-ATPase catalytic subunit A/Vma1